MGFFGGWCLVFFSINNFSVGIGYADIGTVGYSEFIIGFYINDYATRYEPLKCQK